MRTIITILFVTLTINSFGQEDSTSIYYKALWYYNSHLDSIKSNESELYISYSKGITENLPKQIGGRRIFIITKRNKVKIYKNNDNFIIETTIFESRLVKDDVTEVCITPYIGEYKGKRKGIYLALSDWVIIQFKYDTENKTYNYLTTLTGGI